jgi:hypothetical protein
MNQSLLEKPMFQSPILTLLNQLTLLRQQVEVARVLVALVAVALITKIYTQMNAKVINLNGTQIIKQLINILW